MVTKFDSRDIAPYAPARFRFYRRWANPDRVAYRVEVPGETWAGYRRITVSGEVTHARVSEFLHQWESREWTEDSFFVEQWLADIPGVREGWRRVALAASGRLGPAACAK